MNKYMELAEELKNIKTQLRLSMNGVASASMREKGILPAEGAPLAAPGTILGVEDEALLVACGDGVYAFSRLCPAGKKPMSGRAFYNGYLAGASHALFALEG